MPENHLIINHSSTVLVFKTIVRNKQMSEGSSVYGVNSASSACLPEQEYDTNKIVEICPGLWLGGLAAVSEIHKLARRWTVISVLKSAKLSEFLQKALQEIKQKDAAITTNKNNASCGVVQEHIEWELPDQSRADFLSSRLIEILERMDPAIMSIQEAMSAQNKDLPRACLVHCAFGVSRSVSVCAAWLLSRHRCTSLAEALDCIRKVRPEASPNMGFLAGLRALEQTQGDVEAAMERMKSRRAGSD